MVAAPARAGHSCRWGGSARQCRSPSWPPGSPWRLLDVGPPVTNAESLILNDPCLSKVCCFRTRKNAALGDIEPPSQRSRAELLGGSRRFRLSPPAARPLRRLVFRWCMVRWRWAGRPAFYSGGPPAEPRVNASPHQLRRGFRSLPCLPPLRSAVRSIELFPPFRVSVGPGK